DSGAAPRGTRSTRHDGAARINSSVGVKRQQREGIHSSKSRLLFADCQSRRSIPGVLVMGLQRCCTFARSGRWAWGSAICLVGIAASCWAQDAPDTSGPEALREAYQASQSATSEADFTRVIRACERGLAESTGVHAEYARHLMSWALNKRGEVRAE